MHGVWELPAWMMRAPPLHVAGTCLLCRPPGPLLPSVTSFGMASCTFSLYFPTPGPPPPPHPHVVGPQGHAHKLHAKVGEPDEGRQHALDAAVCAGGRAGGVAGGQGGFLLPLRSTSTPCRGSLPCTRLPFSESSWNILNVSLAGGGRLVPAPISANVACPPGANARLEPGPTHSRQ